MIKTEDLIERIGKVVGENDSDEYLELLDYIRENNETEDTEDWKKKYEDNDKAWRTRYKERFFKKSEKDEEVDEDLEEDLEKKYSYEELFVKEEK